MAGAPASLPPPHCCWSCLVLTVNKAKTIMPLAGKRPVLGDRVFVAPSASVIGDVKLGDGASVWYGAVVRGARRPAGRCQPLEGRHGGVEERRVRSVRRSRECCCGAS